HQAGDDLEYAWNVTASPEGSTARLVGADTATPMLTPDVAGDYTVSLVVAHGGVASARETTTVTARAPGLIPVAADSRTLTITVADDARPPDPTTRNAVLHYVGYDRTSGEVM